MLRNTFALAVTALALASTRHRSGRSLARLALLFGGILRPGTSNADRMSLREPKNS